MRLSVTFVVLFFFQIGVASAQQITLNEKKIALEDVFNIIHQQSGYDFIFDLNVLQDIGPISIRVENVSIQEALNQCLSGQPLSYVINDRSILIQRRPLKKEKSLARSQLVEGKVLDTMGRPLFGATINIPGRTQATSTDANGNFSIDNKFSATELSVSYVGYENRKVSITGDLLIIKLQEAPSQLQEVVINKGYYNEAREVATGNSFFITAKELQTQPVSNPLLALEGRVPGLQISQSSGISNGPVKVLVRGTQSISYKSLYPINMNPLFLINGVPYPGQLYPELIGGSSGAENTNGESGGNPLNFINAADIERIDILKDADATSIYGARGSQGVILITTKKGKKGPLKAEINISSGVSTLARQMKTLNTQQYLAVRQEAFKNDGRILPDVTIPSGSSNTDFDINGVWDQARYTDWRKELTGRSAGYTNGNLNLSGGTENLKYMVSGTYNRQGTVYPGDFNDQKKTVMFSVVSSPVKRLSIDLTGSYLSDRNYLPGNDLSQFIFTAPDAPAPFKADGSLNFGSPAYNYEFQNNPYIATLRTYKNQTGNLLLQLMPSYQIGKGLNAKVNVGYSGLNSKIVQKYPWTIYPVVIPGNPFTENYAVYTNASFRTWIAEPQLTYDLQLNKFRINVLAGSTFQQTVSKDSVKAGVGYASDDLLNDIKNARQSGNVTSFLDQVYRYSAIFGRLNINYQDKYIFNLTGRRDGSSRFGEDNRFAMFYAVGAAWIFTKERFFSDHLPFLSSGKIRGSFGTTGSDNIPDYYSDDNYTQGAFSYQGFPTLTSTRPANSALQWAKSEKMEVALELGFLDNRFMLSAAYYRERTNNQLLELTLPEFTGFDKAAAYNSPATVQNKGLEIYLNSVNVNNAVFQWKSGFNFSFNRNKLISYPDLSISGYNTVLAIGQPVTAVRAYKYAGVDPKTGLYNFVMNDGTISAFNTTYSPLDLTEWVDTAPTFIGGLYNKISFKQFEIDGLLQFVKQKGPLLSQTISIPGSFSSFGLKGNIPYVLLDRWQQPGDQANYQKFSTGSSETINGQAIFQSSTGNYTDASFIRLKNLQLAYSISTNLLRRLRIKGGKVYVQGQNLFTLTPYKGWDPETHSFDVLPPLKVITLGIKCII